MPMRSSIIMIRNLRLRKYLNRDLKSALEIVTYPPLCVYILRVRRVFFDLLAQAADVDVHGPYVTRVFIAPDDVEEVFAAVDLVGVEHEELEHIKLLGCQIDLFAIYEDASALTVEPESGYLDLFRLFLLVLRLRGAPQDRRDVRREGRYL